MLVRPQDRIVLIRSGLRRLGHDIVQVHDNVLGLVSHHHEEASLLLLHSILDERLDARVSIFSLLAFKIRRPSRNSTYTTLRAMVAGFSTGQSL